MGKPSTTDRARMGKPTTTDQARMGKPTTTDQARMGKPKTTEPVRMDKPKTTEQDRMGKPTTTDHTRMGKPSTTESKPKRQWCKIALKLLLAFVAFSALTLCLVCAAMSIIKYMEVRDKEVSSYRQNRQPGDFYVTPGLIFLGRGVTQHSCELFNFTSLDIDAIEKDPCSIEYSAFTLDSREGLSQELQESFPKFLRELAVPMTFVLNPGPRDWSNKETIQVHFTVPSTENSMWMMVHEDLEQIVPRFQEAAAATREERWTLARDLLRVYPLTMLSAQYRSMFLMTTQVFKYQMQVSSVRVALEVSMMLQNETYLDERINYSKDPDLFDHVEGLYQWKDGYYMEGNSFVPDSLWPTISVFVTAALMLERGFMTLKRLLNMKIFT